LVQWNTRKGISSFARSLGCTRPTVRKYLRAAERTCFQCGGQSLSRVGVGAAGPGAARTVAHQRAPSVATPEVAPLRKLAQRVRVEHGDGRRLGERYQLFLVQRPPAP